MENKLETTKIEGKCLFCGVGKIHLILVDQFLKVECMRCGAAGPLGMTEQEAISLWNSRYGNFGYKHTVSGDSV